MRSEKFRKKLFSEEFDYIHMNKKNRSRVTLKSKYSFYKISSAILIYLSVAVSL